MSLQPQFVILPTVVVLVAVLALVCFRFAARALRKPSEYAFLKRSWWDSGWSMGAAFSTAIGGLLLLATLIMMLPFNPSYWAYHHVTGTVADVSNRFVVGSGKVTSPDYVLRIQGLPGVYNVQDDRIQGVEVGQKVDLTCTVEWVYEGQDQNNCFIRSWAVTG